MTAPDARAEFEAQIAQWREYVLRRKGVGVADADELEEHLRDQTADLESSGLAPDEAFLVAVKRLGAQDEISREFARVHSDRLWKQLVLTGTDVGGESVPGTRGRVETRVVIGLALLAAIALKVPALFGVTPQSDAVFYVRNAALFALPFVAAYFAWKRAASIATVMTVAAAFAVGGAVANAYPFTHEGQTEWLTAIHLPIALWLMVGVVYAGGEWRSRTRRMDFVRFTGEWVVYMSLIALGGGVLAGITVGAFSLVDVETSTFVGEWLLPCGAVGAGVVAAWLVEAKQGVIENLAPVLTRIFTPLFAAMLIVLAVAFGVAWSGDAVNRDALVVLDLVLALVLGLVLFAISARESLAPPGLFDALQLVLVVAALAVDALVLAGILSRIGEYGFTANRTAALGENLVLLANLAWTAWLALGFLRGRRAFAALERWQTTYIPVYLAWAAAVVVALPPLFGFA